MERKMEEKYKREKIYNEMMRGMMRIVEIKIILEKGILRFDYYVGIKKNINLYYKIIIIEGRELLVMIMELNGGYKNGVMRREKRNMRRVLVKWEKVMGEMEIEGFILKI